MYAHSRDWRTKIKILAGKACLVSQNSEHRLNNDSTLAEKTLPNSIFYSGKNWTNSGRNLKTPVTFLSRMIMVSTWYRSKALEKSFKTAAVSHLDDQ